MSLELITTQDGSHSLLNTDLNETYHSVHGAVQESRHVFIANGLDFYNDRNGPRSINVLEVGFGTGLNALLALEWSIRHSIDIHYISLETAPVDTEFIEQLNYTRQVIFENAREYFHRIHSAQWNTKVEIRKGFILEKKLTRVQDYFPDQSETNVIFFDAFAPSRQPELWELSVLKQACSGLVSSGVFVTYCAKGQLKRDLRSLEFLVETLPGPPGKKEMVRAIR